VTKKKMMSVLEWSRGLNYAKSSVEYLRGKFKQAMQSRKQYSLAEWQLDNFFYWQAGKIKK